MIEISQIMQLLQIEPGSGLLQSALLLMIWLTSLGVRKDIKSMGLKLIDHNKRLEKIEGRLTILETKER